MNGFEMVFWHWWIIGVFLVILEAFAPGAFFLWAGVSAFVVGGILMIIPGMTWEFQLLIFALLSVVSILVWRKWFLEASEKSESPNLNRRGQQYVGRTFVLESTLENGVGRIKVDDTLWRVMGEDCPVGSRVKVVGVDGVMLKVECLPG